MGDYSITFKLFGDVLCIMSNLNLSGGIERKIADPLELKKLLLQNGFEGSFKTPKDFGQYYTSDSLTNLLEQTVQMYGFEIPKQDYWSMFFKLGSQELDAAYLYSPQFKDYTVAKRPVFEHLGNVVEGVSRLTNMPVIAFSELDRFAIPKIQVFDSGTKTFISKNAGTEMYSPDYWIKDEEAYVQRAKKSATAFANKVKGMFDDNSGSNMLSD